MTRHPPAPSSNRFQLLNILDDQESVENDQTDTVGNHVISPGNGDGDDDYDDDDDDIDDGEDEDKILVARRRTLRS
jgi:hypothetical protein